MIRTKKIFCNGFYVFQGKSSANSLFIEDLVEARQFLILANFYFSSYLKIYEYLLTKDGWVMIVKVNAYESLPESVRQEFREEDVWRVISERMRLFLSRFVKFTNRKQGRTGSKVHSVYERYFFESLGECMRFIKLVKNRLVKLHQSRRKYRSKKSHFRIPRKLGKGSIFLSSRGKKKKKNAMRILGEAFDLIGFTKHVASELVKNTRKHHFSVRFQRNSPYPRE